MVNQDLLFLVERVLGKGKRTSGDNYAFYSPFINHQKPKLEINFDSFEQNVWHCWVSNERGRSVETLFKRLNVHRTLVEELRKLLHGTKLHVLTARSKTKETRLQLPDEFIPIAKHSKLTNINQRVQVRRALAYLKNRGLQATDIVRYNIGYCTDGMYSGRVVIPSYDENCILNYFVTRTIHDDVSYKYKNPGVSKDVIGFEAYINWDEPVTLVEGVFDAITARFNAIPLFGKTMSPRLKEKLLTRRPPNVRIALDNDALRDALSMCDYLVSNNIPTTLVKMSDKDVSVIGFDSFSKQIKECRPIDSFDLIKEKIFA